MCKANNEGIKFKDGTFIEYGHLDVLNLSEVQIKELYASPMSLADGVQIRRRLHTHGNFLQNLGNKLDLMNDKLDDSIKRSDVHTNNCPINVKNVETIVDDRVENSEKIESFLLTEWKKIFKNTVLTWGNMAKALTAIITFLAVFGFIIFIVIKQFNN